MKHFPLFLDLDGRCVVVSGAGECAVHKLRLLLKTSARIKVYGRRPVPQIRAWAMEGRLELFARPLHEGDAEGATLCYCANDNPAEDARAAEISRAQGALVSIVDNLVDSEFITPAIVDRDPVTVAIGTEGAAPVLARKIKAELEAMLPVSLGLLARIGQQFRSSASVLKPGQQRRRFWSRFFEREGPDAISNGGESAARASLGDLLNATLAEREVTGKVFLVGAGPGDAELMTLKARRALDSADTVLCDSSVPGEVLELARRESEMIIVDDRGCGTSLKHPDAIATAAELARAGKIVVRLKTGDPAVFGGLDGDIAVLEEAGVQWEIVPGVTAASASAAAIGQSLTCGNGYSGIRLVTAQELDTFSERDWQDLSRPGAVAAIYMGIGAARLIQGRLLMYGASEGTAVTVVENASRPNQKIFDTTIVGLPGAIVRERVDGPALLLLGLLPRNRSLGAGLNDLAKRML